LYVHSPWSEPALADVVECAHRFRLPVLVDAAAELPPRSNLKEIVGTGADLVAFSGGKAIRGPQSTGILCGRSDLIGAAAVQMLDQDDHFALWDPPAGFIDKSQLAGMPRHGIGRALKVSKEEIAGLLVALDLFASGAYASDLPSLRECLDLIAAALRDQPVECRILEQDDGESPPLLEIKLAASQPDNTAFSICRALRRGTPPIYVGHGRLAEDVLIVNPLCLTRDQAETIARRIGEELCGRQS
jgi:L-seryl-tRNA(Ser) seleniumtransferase